MLKIEAVVYSYLMPHSNSSPGSAAFEKAWSMKHGASVSMWKVAGQWIVLLFLEVDTNRKSLVL